MMDILLFPAEQVADDLRINMMKPRCMDYTYQTV